VGGGQTLIESQQAAVTMTRQRGKVCIGDLPMSQDSLPCDIGVGKRVRPEPMARMSDELLQYVVGRFHGRYSLRTHQHPQKRALGNRARRKGNVARCEPRDRVRMVDVRRVDQCDQHVAVEQNLAGHDSSSSALTSSSVTGRGERTTGNPVCGWMA